MPEPISHSAVPFSIEIDSFGRTIKRSLVTGGAEAATLEEYLLMLILSKLDPSEDTTPGGMVTTQPSDSPMVSPVDNKPQPTPPDLTASGVVANTPLNQPTLQPATEPTEPEAEPVVPEEEAEPEEESETDEPKS